MTHLYSRDSYHFDIPQELIAQTPMKERDQSRLLIIDRKTGSIEEAHFSDLVSILQEDDALILNNSRVILASLQGTVGLGKVHCLLCTSQTQDTWTIFAKPAKKLQKGTTIIFSSDLHAEVQEILEDGARLVTFTSA
jgi:S-adenosylmethionine:tRNA ribosyltransferase-isomerase